MVLSCTVSKFRDIACFCTHDPTPISPNFGVFPLDQITHVGVSPSRYLKLFSREIISEVFQRYLNVTGRRTDRQTDDILWHNRALRSIAR